MKKAWNEAMIVELDIKATAHGNGNGINNGKGHGYDQGPGMGPGNGNGFGHNSKPILTPIPTPPLNDDVFVDGLS